MAVFERSEIRGKKRLPSLLIILMVLGAFGGVGIYRWVTAHEKDTLLIGNIQATDTTRVSATIRFDVENRSDIRYKKKPVLIKIVGEDNEEIASRLTTVDIEPGIRQRHAKTISNFIRPLKTGEPMTATVEFYRHSFWAGD